MNQLELQKTESEKKIALQAEINRATEAEKIASKTAERDLQGLIDAVHDAELARKQKEFDQMQSNKEAAAALEKQKQDAYAETVAKIMGAIAPGLIEALTSKSNEDMLAAVTESIAPYALAKGESVSEVVNKLLRGTALEDVIKDVNLNV